MDKIYTVAMDSFDKGMPIRNAYMVSDGPYDSFNEAQEAACNGIQNLYEKYRILETNEKKFDIGVIGENELVLIMKTLKESSIVARYTVFEVDPTKVLDYKSAGIKATFKKGTVAQMAHNKKKQKINQYISCLKPTIPNWEDIV